MSQRQREEGIPRKVETRVVPWSVLKLGLRRLIGGSWIPTPALVATMETTG